MPLYDFECECGHTEEKIVPMDERNIQQCPSCRSTLSIAFKPQARYVPFKHYFDLGLGEEITSYAQHQKVMRQQQAVARELPSKGEMSARKDRAMERQKARARARA